MMAIVVVITPTGSARMVFDDNLDLRAVGPTAINRGSHVEPTNDSQWTADLSPVGGPTLGPFDQRREALAAELTWLQKNWLIRASE